jgi:hypothetical protein
MMKLHQHNFWLRFQTRQEMQTLPLILDNIEVYIYPDLSLAERSAGKITVKTKVNSGRHSGRFFRVQLTNQ